MSETERVNPTPAPVDWLAKIWRRIKEHKVVQWAVAYIAVAYGLQHGVVLTSDAFEWPHVVQQVSMLLLAFGVPLVMTFAWYHGTRASRNFSRAELSILAALLVIASLLFYVFVHPTQNAAPVAQTAGATAVRQANATALPRGTISLAVLPFLNLSGDPQQEFFSDGMTEEITSALAKIANLRVVGRTSAFQFKGQNRDLRAIGQALSATHLIEGSVRKAGNRVRITAQLIRADNGSHVWTDSYDRQLSDIFAIQEDIAQAIAAALRAPLGLQQELVSNRSIPADLYQQYLRGKALVRARGETSLRDAIALLEQVVEHESTYAPAWALLAEAYATLPDYVSAFGSGDVEELRRVVQASLPKAEAAARRAIELDPKSGDGYLNLGFTQATRFQWLAAEELYSKALALDPDNPEGLHRYGNLLAAVGRTKDAVAMRQRLQQLEPFVPTFSANTAAILWVSGQDDAAITMLKALPEATRAIYLARIYAAAGRFGQAAENM